MQYIDPYTLFDLDPGTTESLDRDQIKRAKQKVLAEFELSEEVVIELQGYEIDKATALRLLEELENPEKRQQHWVLHQTPALQKFMQQQKVRLLKQIPPADQLGDDAFQAFLSQQLVPVFDRLLSDNFRRGRKPEFALLVSRLDLIGPRDRDTAMSGTMRQINLNLQALNEAASGSAEELVQFEGEEMWGNHLIEMVNRLPDMYQNVRNRYAEALQSLAVRLENEQSNTQKAFKVICAAADLETDLITSDPVNSLKVVLWQRLREKQGQTGFRQTSQQQEQKSQPFEYQWEDPEQQDENHYHRTRRRNSGTPVWIAIGLIILVVAFLTQGKWKSRSYTSPGAKIEFSPPSLSDLEYLNLDEEIRASNEAMDFREDLFFALKEQERSSPMARDYVPFTTGDKPLEGIIPAIEDQDEGNSELTITNDSKKGLVIFLSSYANATLDDHVYIGPGDTYEFGTLSFGLRDVHYYSGTNWAEDVYVFDGSTVGGFTSKSQGPTKFEAKEGDASYNFSVQNIGLDKAHYILTYDGDRLQLTDKQ